MQDSLEAIQLLEQLKQATQKSEEYRSKLHGAIRKGKASEAARIGLEKEVEELKARLSQQNAVQASMVNSCLLFLGVGRPLVWLCYVNGLIAVHWAQSRQALSLVR